MSEIPNPVAPVHPTCRSKKIPESCPKSAGYHPAVYTDGSRSVSSKPAHPSDLSGNKPQSNTCNTPTHHQSTPTEKEVKAFKRDMFDALKKAEETKNRELVFLRKEWDSKIKAFQHKLKESQKKCKQLEMQVVAQSREVSADERKLLSSRQVAQVGRASEEADTEMEDLMQNKLYVLRTLPGVNPEKALHNLEQMSQSVLEQKDEKNSKDKRDEVQSAEERAPEYEQETLETEQLIDPLPEQIRLQLQRAKERAKRAKERATRAEERATRAEKRATRVEKEILDTTQEKAVLQQQLGLQVQKAEERVTRAEERATRVEERAIRAEERAITAEESVAIVEERAATAEERAITADERATKAEQELMLFSQQSASRQKCQTTQGIPQHSQASWKIGRDEIEVIAGKPLGIGGWGEVRVAMFRGVKVAAKLLHEEIISPHNTDLFIREMNMAASVRHPNLLLFIGACFDDSKPVILTELMPTNLRSNIRALPRVHAVSISLDVACGLNYLHLVRPDPIIHRDISSANVLLERIGSGNWKAKVADYGSANFLSKVITMGPGNPSYAAPESSNPKLQSPKMDVYSYGILLLEMATGQFPDQSLQAVQLESLLWKEMKGMITKCICDDPGNRPTMKDILILLPQLNKQM